MTTSRPGGLCIPAPPIRAPAGVERAPMPLALLTDYRWPADTDELHVRFLGGDAALHKQVQSILDAPTGWNALCGMRFVFDNAEAAEIRIAFAPGGSWSQMGRSALAVQKTDPTMNFGWLSPDLDSAEARRVVLHEFGHALGFIHEHLRPDAGIPFDLEKTYAYFAQQDWSREDVDSNVLIPYPLELLTASARYDPRSLMIYALPAEILKDPSYATPYNTVPSETDIAFARAWYGPGPEQPQVNVYLPNIMRGAP